MPSGESVCLRQPVTAELFDAYCHRLVAAEVAAEEEEQQQQQQEEAEAREVRAAAEAAAAAASPRTPRRQRLPSGWQADFSPAHQRVFYRHDASGQTTFQAPHEGEAESTMQQPAAAIVQYEWSEFTDDDTGRLYYHNTESEAVQWERPADFPGCIFVVKNGRRFRIKREVLAEWFAAQTQRSAAAVPDSGLGLPTLPPRLPGGYCCHAFLVTKLL